MLKSFIVAFKKANILKFREKDRCKTLMWYCGKIFDKRL